MAWDTGASLVIGPDEGQTHWQRPPHWGYITVKVSPPAFPSNLYAVITYTVPIGAELPRRIHERAEQLFYVLSGTATATVGDTNAEMEGSALVYVGRQIPHRFVNSGDSALVLYSVIWPPGHDLDLAQAGRPRTSGDQYPEDWMKSAEVASGNDNLDHVEVELGLPKTCGPIIFSGPGEGDSYWQPTPTEGWATIKLSPANLASNHVTVVEQVVPPGKRLPAHGHPRNEELKLITTGTGTATVDGVEHDIRPGSLCVTGRWVEHSFLNTGNENLTILAIFQPPALEGLIRELGRPRIAGQPAPTPFGAPDDVVAIVERNSLVLPHEIAAHQNRNA